MKDTRSLAYDATFMIIYIGFTAAMVCLSATLLALLALEHDFGALHLSSAAANLAGWVVLPFAPRLYRTLVGKSFTWRSNAPFSGEAA